MAPCRRRVSGSVRSPHELAQAPQEEVWDVCIVGAGAAGLSLLQGLAGSGLSVLLLEGGGPVRDAVVDASNHRMSTGADYPFERSRSRIFGGTDSDHGLHQMGATRRADDPTRGVVGTDCRVHGMGNLCVSGGSVFATGGAANPTLTIVALAQRPAAHLRERLARNGGRVTLWPVVSCRTSDFHPVNASCPLPRPFP